MNSYNVLETNERKGKEKVKRKDKKKAVEENEVSAL